MKYNKILITGGTGYVGSELVPILVDAGYNIRVVGTKHQKEVNYIKFNDKVEYIQADLRKEDEVNKALEGVDFIVHMASIVGEGVCRKNSELAYDINVGIVKNIEKQREGRPIIFLSSSSIYGSQSRGEFDEKSSFEIPDELIYAKTKYEGEKQITSSDNYVVLRPASFFGFASKMNYNSLINNFTKDAIDKKKLEIYDNGLMRTFVHVKDISRMIKFMIENFDEYKNEIFNAGSNELNCTKLQVAETIKKYCNFELIDTSGEADPDKRDFIVVYDKLESTGFKFEYSLDSGIKDLASNIKKKRIAVLVWDLSIKGGTQRQALEMAKALQNSDCEVDIYCYEYDKENCYDICHELNIYSVIEKHCGRNTDEGNVQSKEETGVVKKIKNIIYKHFHFYFINKKVKNFNELIKEKGDLEYYDVVNCHDGEVYKISRMNKYKNIVWMLNDMPISIFEGGGLLARTFVYFRSLFFATLYKDIRVITVLDNRVQGLVEKCLNIKAKVVRSGVDQKMYNDIRKEKNFNKKKFEIFLCGIYFPHRRYEDMVDAVELLSKKNINNIHVTINGRKSRCPEYYDEIEKRIKDKGLERYFNLVDGMSNDDLLNKYMNSDIFVFPNNPQTWGLAVFEAMLAGCVCLVSKGCGAHEVLTDGKDTLLVEPNNPKDIAKKIAYLISNSEKMKTISDNGIKFVKENISWNNYSKQMLKIFEYEK